MNRTKRIDFDLGVKVAKRLLKSRKRSDCYDAAILIMGLFTSYRVSDYRELVWADLIRYKETVSPNGGRVKVPYVVEMIWVTEMKTGKANSRVLGESARALLLELYGVLKPEPFHCIIRGNGKTGPMTRQGIHKRLVTCGKKHGLSESNVAPHSLRKAGAFKIYTALGEDHMAAMVVQKALNHTSIASTLTYIGVDTDMVNNAYLNL